jgi:stage V sporulation protein D (sporulation-specific penicillin-binding protein)
MKSPAVRSRKRIIFAFGLFCALLLAVCIKVGYIQIVQGEELTKKAIAQQTNDEAIEAKRGEIRDRNGKELAVSTICYSLWARPAAMEDKDAAAKTLAEITDMDAEEIKEMITQDKSLVKIAKYLDSGAAEAIRKAEMPGVSLTEESKRSYPLGEFASHLLGSVTDDNNGLTGLEQKYNGYLKGVSGRWLKNTDASGNPLAYGADKYYEAENGATLLLTIDEVLQHYTEKAIDSVAKTTEADRVSCLIMDPETGEILAAASTPGFDPNDPRTPTDEVEAKKLRSMSEKNQMEYLNEMWRDPLFNDTYEPGSTAKLVTTAIALEEGLTDTSEGFVCTGSIELYGETLKCWRSENPHGHQTLTEAVGNSCNPVFVTLSTRIGLEKYYKYLELFGLTQKTGIDFPGEANSILQNKETAGPIGLATMAYGQGIAMTPVQLLTAACALGNDGKLMKPRLVKEIRSDKGETIKKFRSEVVRQVVSKETADEMCLIMESVVEEGGAGTAKIEGYRVGGKTGTANKVINGKYSETVCSSFIGMAPMDDPKIAVLFIVDNPKGQIYGSATAAPGARQVLENALRYMKVEPDYTAAERQENSKKTVVVPNVTGESYSEAIGILGGADLKHKVSPDIGDGGDFIVKDQYPKAGEEIEKTGTVYLYRK